MKSITTTRIFLIRAACIGACIGGAFAFASQAIAANDVATTMSVDQDAPVRVTLMPTPSVFASRANPDHAVMHVAATAPLAATLLPTVHVTTRWAGPYASAQPEAPAMAWSQEARVDALNAAPRLRPHGSADAQPDVTAPTLRALMMPR